MAEPKQGASGLRQGKERCKDLIDLLPQIIFEAAKQGSITFLNHAAFQLFGYAQGDFDKGINIFEMLVPEDTDSVNENIERVLSGESLEAIEYSARRKDGSTFPVLAYLHPIMHENTVVGIRGIGIDITPEHKKTEAALRESERYHWDLFYDVSDAIVRRDLEGNIVEANQAMSTLSGYSVDELGRMNISNFLTREGFNIAMEAQQRQLEGKGALQRYELELARKNATKADIESVTTLVTQNGQPVGVQAIIRDVSKQKRLRENMRFYIAAVTKAQEEERKRIARELHDETAQSLASLSLDIEAVTRDSEHLSEAVIHSLELARGKIERVLQGIRRFSHELRPQVLDQLGLIPAVETLTQELKREGKTDSWLELIGFERRLSPEAELLLFRIAQEALCNVRKHSQATEAAVRIEFTKKEVKLRVVDNGRGFELPEILDDFVGTGKLGLIGMRERAQLLGGSFSLKSRPGKGTSVAVEVVA